MHSARNLPRTLAAAAEAGWQVLGTALTLAGSTLRKACSVFSPTQLSSAHFCVGFGCSKAAKLYVLWCKRSISRCDSCRRQGR